MTRRRLKTFSVGQALFEGDGCLQQPTNGLLELKKYKTFDSVFLGAGVGGEPLPDSSASVTAGKTLSSFRSSSSEEEE